MRTTTDAENFRFSFTVTDMARFLGKSPVTLRHWERQGLVIFPRDGNGDRRVTVEQVRYMARTAKKLGRIDEPRLNMIEAAVYLLEQIETRNAIENRPRRSPTVRQNGTSEAVRDSPITA